ncbi:MAG: glycosyltransferase family 39 protein [Fimbriimonadaceae bacterium]|jgi:4-amino-4-deoxy-L-arabinose transferase-like glycosyltransferase|nr:glycosyltransferase family 39 protein [Fimbriimonadaceae bacterium]
MKALVPLILLLAAFLGLSVAYSTATPYRTPGVLAFQRGPDGLPARVPDVGAPDERQHANYISHLLQGKGFPVLRPGSADLGETYQSHQPPLYYLLAAGWAKVAGLDPTLSSAGVPLRLLNSLVGLATLLGIYFLVFWGTGKRSVANAATAFAALLPMFVALHGAVSNDPLLFCLCTWVLALCVKGSVQHWSLRLSVGIGFLVGLALLTKTSALALVPLLLVALYLAHRQETPEDRPTPLAMAIAILLPLVIFAPWALRNFGLYGDFLAISAFNQAFVGSPQAAGFIEMAGPVGYWTQWVGWWTGRSLVGFFGYMDIQLFESLGLDSNRQGAFYSLVLAIFGFATLFWFVKSKDLAEEDPSPASLLPLQVLSGLLAILTLVLFVRFNLQYFQGQARYLFLAIGPLALWVGGGVCGVMKGRKDWAWLVIAIFLGALSWVGYQTLGEAFLRRTIGAGS